MMVSLLFFAVATIVLVSGIFTLLNNYKAAVNRLYFVITVALTIWSSGVAMSTIVTDVATSELFRRIAAIGWSTVHAMLLHFFLIITGKSSVLKKKWHYIGLYLPALLTIFAFVIPNSLNPQPYNLHQTDYGWMNVPLNNLWDWIFYIYCTCYSLLGLVLLYSWGKKSSSEIVKKNSKTMILAIVLALGLGTFTDLILSSFLPKYPQMAPVVMLIPALTTYHILQKDTFNIAESIEKKSSYIVLLLCIIVYIVLSAQLVSLKDGTLTIGSVIIGDSAIRGIIVQVQMFVSIYLVLKETRPGYIAAVLMNSIILLSSVAYAIQYGSSNFLPGIISYMGVIVIISLIKAYKERNAAAVRRFTYDNEHVRLTGLFNRSVLERILTRDAIQSSLSGRALICIDLFAMHDLSRRYGYNNSQNIRKNIAGSLEALCNEKYSLFDVEEYRYIYYIKRYEDENELLNFSKGVSETVSSYLNMYGIKSAIGILQIDELGEDSAEVFDANILLKKVMDTSEVVARGKGADNDILFYTTEVVAQLNRETEISNEIAGIVDGTRLDDLYLQYQPIYDVAANKISGFEALARITNEEYGLIPPVEFIRIAEKTNLIVPFGERIIAQALQFLRKLKMSGHDAIAVSINISITQMLANEFSQMLLGRIHELDINPKNVGVELTETVFATERADINAVVNELKVAGIKVLIDDFGTGYSSFARERELDIDYLKIDKSFIDRLLDLDQEETITGDIIAMAHKLGHGVVAEGVEHEKQLQYLRDHGCDKVRGYLISKPLDEDAALEFLNYQRPWEADDNHNSCRADYLRGTIPPR